MTLDLRLAVTDQVVGDVPVKIKCPDRIHKGRLNGKTDKQHSLAVYYEHIHCYGCHYNRSGVWGLADLLEMDIDTARTVVGKYDSDSLDAYRERAASEARRDPLPGSLARIYNDILLSGPRAHRIGWLKARGLTVATIHGQYLGHDGNRFVIPVFDAEERLISLRYRRDEVYCEENTPKYSGLKGRNGFYIYPEQRIAEAQPAYLVLCEGELDALRLWQEGIPAVTATNGAGQAPKVITYIKEHYPSVRTWLIATDMDEPGREAARIAAEEVNRQGFSGHTILEWTHGKDITEALQLGSLRAEFIRTYCTR